MNIIAQAILFIMAYGTPAMLILLHVLHLILPKKFDTIWFNQTHFTEAELAIYSSYPLSLVKTLGYSAAICLPFLMKKRFTNLRPAEEVSIFIKLLSYIFLLLVFLILLSGLLAISAAFLL